jgi:hypothetical protein
MEVGVNRNTRSGINGCSKYPIRGFKIKENTISLFGNLTMLVLVVYFSV